ncbi:ATP-binding protein [Flavobacteriaceae bacterium]|nr:ATP-binding protein [Flavobacteriaceae bacterium]
MARFKNYKSSLWTSLFIVIFAMLLQWSYHFIFNPEVSTEMDWGFLIFFYCGLFLFTFFLLYIRIERFIHSIVSNVYQDFSPTAFTSKSDALKSDVETMTRSLHKIASDKKLEIQLLKDQENYRREFIGNISHELKTPLFTIQAYVLTLLDGALADKNVSEKYIKRTAKGVERLIYIVNDMDLMNKFESGIQTINKKPFNLIELIQNIFDLLEMKATKSKIKLVLDKAYDQPIYVYADADRIQQVISNLIINSIKYGTDKGTTELSIQEINAKKILLRVTDNGEGIEKLHLPRLFERFYRVDKTRNRAQGGSGLGLAIVKHIIEAHNEKIFVESELGVGSEFSFTLTKADAPPQKITN